MSGLRVPLRSQNCSACISIRSDERRTAPATTLAAPSRAPDNGHQADNRLNHLVSSLPLISARLAGILSKTDRLIWVGVPDSLTDLLAPAVEFLDCACVSLIPAAGAVALRDVGRV